MQLTILEIQKAKLIAEIVDSFIMPSDECGQAAVYGIALYLIENDFNVEWMCKALLMIRSSFKGVFLKSDFDDVKRVLEYKGKNSAIFFENYYYMRQAMFCRETEVSTRH